MKIIFVLRSVVLAGGIERVVIDKANWLAKKGHMVTLLTYEQGNHPLSFPLSPQVSYIDLECRYFTIYRHNILLRPFLKYKMKRTFRKRLYSLIEMSHPDIMVLPHNLNEFQHEIVSMSPFVHIVYEAHSTSIELLKGNTLSRRLKCHRITKVLKKVDMVITLTQGDASLWKKYFNHIKTVPNPLSLLVSKYDDYPKEAGKIIYVGRLHSVKRVDRLILAFALIADNYPVWHIDIYGEGEEKDHIEKLIHDYGLTEKIKINAPISNIYDEYRNSQFLVLSSDSESFSLVIIEAMSCGIPVVSTDCPFGPREIIADGKTGLLSRLEAEDLAAKMEWMITHETERREMGRRAHETVARYQKDNVMKEWEAAYFSVLR